MENQHKKLEEFKYITKELFEMINSLQKEIDKNGMDRQLSQQISIFDNLVTKLERYLTKFEKGEKTNGLELLLFHD